MKSSRFTVIRIYRKVTPLAGVWIEIPPSRRTIMSCTVTPLAGVWIEIGVAAVIIGGIWCHTPRGCVD